MELCYKLNIPNFEDIVRDDWEHNLSWDNIMNLSKQSTIIPCQEAIKKEFLKFNNIDWDMLVLFPMNKTQGQIHADNSCNPLDRDLSNPLVTLFAINYVVSGTGKIEYWLPSQLENSFTNPKNTYDQVNWTAKESESPHKSYELNQGAYLINASVPHQGIAYDKRIVFSLRPKVSDKESNEYWKTKNWVDIVNMFKDYTMQ